jgi:hypothetical protein
MVDVAGGIILAVILLFVGFIALLLLLCGFVKTCVALDKGFKGFGKWRAAGRTDTKFEDGATYSKADGAASYTKTSAGVLRRVALR